jgi:hypothetical protein
LFIIIIVKKNNQIKAITNELLKNFIIFALFSLNFFKKVGQFILQSFFSIIYSVNVAQIYKSVIINVDLIIQKNHIY